MTPDVSLLADELRVHDRFRFLNSPSNTTITKLKQNKTRLNHRKAIEKIYVETLALFHVENVFTGRNKARVLVQSIHSTLCSESIENKTNKKKKPI